MTPEEIVAKFAEAKDNFEPIQGQPGDVDLKRIRETLSPLLLQIPFDEMEGKDNLVGLIQPTAAYKRKYGRAFVIPTRLGAYDTTIAKDATAVTRSRAETEHRARRKDYTTYETARREARLFIQAVVEDTWIRALRDPDTLYVDVAPADFLEHLHKSSGGRHAIDMVALSNEMQRYH
jgi:hypothetical protein